MMSLFMAAVAIYSIYTIYLPYMAIDPVFVWVGMLCL